MKIQLANIILSILSFFLWKSIRYKHKKLIENGVIKKYGKKVMYAGFVTGIIFINSHNEYEEKKAIEEIRKMVDVIAETDVEDSCYSLIVALMEYALTYGSLIIYTALTIQKYLIKFKTKGLEFPFSLTFFGKKLYSYLLAFLIVSFGIHFLF